MGNIAASVNVGMGFIPQASVSTLPSLRDLHGVVSRSVASARAQGRDYMAQNRAAASVVMSVRPELSLSEALDVVTRLRHEA
jgi:hypothetical protein